jgi:hypothetical protein
MSDSDDQSNGPKKDYLGRILIGFIALSALMWLLVYLF